MNLKDKYAVIKASVRTSQGGRNVSFGFQLMNSSERLDDMSD